MKYVIKSNYNTSLLHFVDYMSMWNEHINNHNYVWFKKNFYINSRDKMYLEKYRKIRVRLGWEKESTLLIWAYNNFTRNKHKKIKEILLHFENKRSRSGIPLTRYIEKKQSKIDKVIPRIEIKLTQKKYSLKKVISLSPTQKKYKKINIFLVPSFNRSEYQAGANGSGVMIEIPGRFRIREVMTLILHELFHKVGNISTYLDKYPDKKLRKVLNRKVYNTMESRNKDIVEESLAYLLTNVRINKENVNVKLREYKKIRSIRERNYFVSIWENIKILVSKKDPIETIPELI